MRALAAQYWMRLCHTTGGWLFCVLLGGLGVWPSVVWGTASSFCPPLAPPDARQRLERVKSGDVQMLRQALAKATPHTTILIADGVYTLQPQEFLEINAAHVTLRSASGKREAVVITGGSINLIVNSDDVTIADLTLSNPKFHTIQVRGEKGVMRTNIYNVRLADAGQQLVKISTGDGALGKFADEGSVACSLLEYTTFARGTATTPPSYTNGVDILAGKGWNIRDNMFRRIRSAEGPAGPAILAWKNARGTVIQRNVLIDCWRGISLGLSAPDKLSRNGSREPYDHQHGLVTNNVILALTERADAAIENNYALNSRILHNTIYYNETLQHAVNWAIEVRFPPTTAIIKNNLVNLPIIARPPVPTQQAMVQGNVSDAKAAWFHNIRAGDFHLVAEAPARGRGILVSDSLADIDGEPRTAQKPPDAGADEFTSRTSDRKPGR